MTCYSPLRTFEADSDEEGKKKLVWKKSESKRGVECYLPCNKCVGCRKAIVRGWAMRIMHEAAMYDDNSFITLTYNEKNLPKDKSLHKDHFQYFIKNLRREFPEKKIRYYHAGEYGGKLGRPHYHAILFGMDFPDKYLYQVRGGKNLYVSPKLESVWKKGYVTVGSVSYESAAYVAGYVQKKVSGDAREAHYGDKNPEYSTMSRRPGIGYRWLEKYGDEVYMTDSVVVNGAEQKPPRYYDNKFKEVNLRDFERIKRAREKQGKRMLPYETRTWHGKRKVVLLPKTDPVFLEPAEKVAKAKLAMSKRSLQ